MSRRIIFSSCGTSIFTNIAKNLGINSKLLYEYSNVREKNQISNLEERNQIEKIINEANKLMLESNIPISKIRELSAEMNGLFAFYGDNIQNARSDMNYLIHTDTWLGKQSALILEAWMKNVIGPDVAIISAGNLQTSRSYDFQAACAELASQIWYSIDRNNRSQEVYFNLTGGFKAIQAFLQSIAQLLGAESFYIFETSNELMRFPRLPIKVDLADVFKNHLKLFRKLYINRGIIENKIELTQTEKTTEIKDIPDTLYFTYENMYDLSAWGLLCWEEEKNKLYSQKIYEPPTPRIEFGESFQSSVKGLEKDRIKIINETIDDLARYLHDGQPLKRSKIQKLKNINGKITHEIYAWSDQDAKRLFGYYKDNNTFVIEYLSDHL